MNIVGQLAIVIDGSGRIHDAMSADNGIDTNQ